MSTGQESNVGVPNANPLLNFINSGIAAPTKASAIINPQSVAAASGKPIPQTITIIPQAPIQKAETQAPEAPIAQGAQEKDVKEPEASQREAEGLDALDLNLNNEEADHADMQNSPSKEDSKEDEESEENSKEVNFSKLRANYKEVRKAVKEKDELISQLQAKITGYETGSEIPEIIATKQARIEELEQYEKLHALKLSPAYKEAMRPAEAAMSRLKELAASYDLPEEELAKIVNNPNERQRNEAIAEYFDVVGATETKTLVETVRGTNAKLKELEATPAKAIEVLEAEHKQLMEVRKAETNQRIAATAKEAWGEVSMKIRGEGKYQELITRPNDPKHNKEIVMPIMQRASTQYSAIVKELAKLGISELPKELAVGLATMVQRAMITTISVESRDIAMREAEELKNNIPRTTSYERPAMGTAISRGIGNTQTPSKPITRTPVQEGRNLIQNIIDKTRR